MPFRKELFQTGEFYHVFNRSIAREEIFTTWQAKNRLIELMDYYRFPSLLSFSRFKKMNTSHQGELLKKIHLQAELVKIISFAVMTNHFHFLVQQTADHGVSKFLQNLQNSYAKYYNLKSDRYGNLFCQRFKAIHISSSFQLLTVSRYIHLNPITAGVIDKNRLSTYPYCSFAWFRNPNLEGVPARFLSSDDILRFFSLFEEYENFVFGEPMLDLI